MLGFKGTRGEKVGVAKKEHVKMNVWTHKTCQDLYTRRYCCDIQLFKSVVIILFNDINFYNSCCQNSYLYFILIFFPQDDAEHMCKVIRDASMERTCKPSFMQCCCSGAPTISFKKISTEMGSTHGRTCNTDLHLDTGKKVILHVRTCNTNFFMI